MAHPLFTCEKYGRRKTMIGGRKGCVFLMCYGEKRKPGSPVVSRVSWVRHLRGPLKFWGEWSGG